MGIRNILHKQRSFHGGETHRGNRSGVLLQMFVGEGRPEIPVTPRRVEFCLTTLP